METELEELFLNRSAGLPVRTEIPHPVLRRARGRMAATAGMAVLVVGGLTGGLTIGARMLGSGELVGPSPSLAAVIPLGETKNGRGSALAVQASADSVWVSLIDGLVRVDARTNEITGRFDGPGFTGDHVLAAGSLWIAEDGVLYRRDAADGRLVAKIPLGPNRPVDSSYPKSVVFGEGSIWVATGDPSGGAVVRIDPATNRVVRQIGIGSFHSLAVGEGGVWLLGRDGLARIDTRSNELGPTHPFKGFLRAVAVGEGSVWVERGEPRLGEESALMRIDPDELRVTAEIKFDYAGGITIGGGAVWVLDLKYPAEIVKIDPRTARIVRRFPADAGWGPPDLGFGAGSLWLTRHEGSDQATIILERFEAK